MQCRTGHAFLGEYYSQFVPNKNIDCPCGEELQTREHILRACPRYVDHRHTLQKASEDICLKDILGTSEGIEALTEFLDESGAFTRTGRPQTTPTEPSYTPLGIWEEITSHEMEEENVTLEADWREETVDSTDEGTEP
ncbi:hypothetical protein EV368DRAFT_46013 [Lentinula lateritia]|nr:hypothetical protein EV368DRAFT_46013 [Lentinula lateritia]